jgi:hypothetical protein
VTTRRSKLARGVAARASWLVPAAAVVVALAPSMFALYNQSFAILGRDQGIFQYVAWALRHGERAYRDIHEINGPLPHAWHMVMQVLGGEDEHVFRSIDTGLLLVVYTLAAVTLPRWVGLELGAGAVRARGIVAWALSGVAVFGPQYARYDWWHTTQRENLYALLILSSLALQSIAHTTRVRRRALVAFGLAGVATTLPWFGKPPCALFAVLQATVLVLDRRELAVSLRSALLAAAAGGILVAASMLVFVLAYGDLGRGIVLLSKVPKLHHTIWNETLVGVYRSYDNAPRLDWALGTSVGFAVAMRAFDLPRRALLAFVLPIGGFVVFATQGKAFPYHLHMLTLGTALMQLLILAGAARKLQGGAGAVTEQRRWGEALAAGAIAFALLLGAKSAEDALLSPGVRGHWATIGATADMRATRAYVDHFPWGDFAANDLRDAAAYLAFHTKPDDRVQTYGFDPYLLFLARRKSASPVIYNFELNVDAALRGGPGARPSAELQAWLMEYRNETEQLVLDAVEASPPAAFALIDHAPFTFPEDSERDFAEHCPHLSRWMTDHYERAAVFGIVRIWLRRDVLPPLR